MGTPLTGASNAQGYEKLRFSTNISLYLWNNARYSYTCNGRPTGSCIWPIYQTAISSMTLNDPKPRFKVTPLFDATYLSQKQYEIHNGIIPGTYTRLTQVCHFKWSWVFKPSDVLNDAKHRAVSLRQLSFVLCVCIMFTLFCAAICRDKQCIIRMYYNVCIAVKCAWVQC